MPEEDSHIFSDSSDNVEILYGNNSSGNEAETNNQETVRFTEALVGCLEQVVQHLDGADLEQLSERLGAIALQAKQTIEASEALFPTGDCGPADDYRERLPLKDRNILAIEEIVAFFQTMFETMIQNSARMKELISAMVKSVSKETDAQQQIDNHFTKMKQFVRLVDPAQDDRDNCSPRVRRSLFTDGTPKEIQEHYRSKLLETLKRGNEVPETQRYLTLRKSDFKYTPSLLARAAERDQLESLKKDVLDAKTMLARSHVREDALLSRINDQNHHLDFLIRENSVRRRQIERLSEVVDMTRDLALRVTDAMPLAYNAITQIGDAQVEDTNTIDQDLIDQLTIDQLTHDEYTNDAI